MKLRIKRGKKMSKKSTNAQKRKMQQIQKKKRMQKMIGFSIGLISIMSIVIVIALSNGNESIQKTQPINTNTIEDDDKITIASSNIDTAASFFTYNSNGVDINYFLVRDDNGNIHAAFDACDVCYDAKKGYVQDGDDMRCVNCGLTFSIVQIGTANTGGGCWPSYLPVSNQDDNIIIDKSDLDNKRFMF